MEKITFEQVKEKAADLAQSGVAKSQILAEMAKLQLSNASEEDAIKKTYQEIGKLYYNLNQENPAPEFIDAVIKISASKNKIQSNKDRIFELRYPSVILSETEIPADAVDVTPDDVTDKED